MDMTGEQFIPADRQAVWAALNDPDVLRRCIPGCQELVKRSETEMTAVVVVKVGPISARFAGAVTLSELDPPNGYRISGEGQGGVAGHASGGAVVGLRDAEGGTILSYAVTAQVGGKLAQLGSRMIDATAKAMAVAFFRKFAEELVGPAPSAAATPGPAAVPRASPGLASGNQPSGPARPPLLWLIVGIVAGALAVILATGAHAGARSAPSAWIDLGLVLLLGYVLGRLQQAPATILLVDGNRSK